MLFMDSRVNGAAVDTA